MKYRRISLFGGPGSGKSTLAPKLYSDLKFYNYNVELVREWVKLWACEKKEIISYDQVYIFAKQLNLEDRLLRSGIDFVVSDSPLFLQCYYASDMCPEVSDELISLAKKVEIKYPSLNIFLKRDHKYDPVGRYQTEEEALEIDVNLKKFLKDNEVSYSEENSDDVLSVVMDVIKQG